MSTLKKPIHQEKKIDKKVRLFIYQRTQLSKIVENEFLKELFNFDLIYVEALTIMMKQDFVRLLSGIQ